MSSIASRSRSERAAPAELRVDLIARFDATCDRNPQRVAYTSAGDPLTYGELQSRSRALAARLYDVLPPDRPVVIHGHKEPQMLIGFLGAMRASRPYVPVDVETPPGRLERIVGCASAPLVLRPADIDEWSRGGLVPPAPEGDAQVPVYVIFTSGSTGDPKGVVVTRESLHTFVSGMLARLGARSRTDGEVVLNQTPFSFDMSLMDIWLALLGGGTLVGLSRDEVRAPRCMYRALEESGATTWISTPSFARMCIAEPRFDRSMLSSLKRFALGGEALPPPLLRRIFERFPDVEMWNIYGPTETTVAATLGRVDPWMLERFPSVPLGEALPGTWLGVVDRATLTVCPEGETGEIVIAGPNVSAGYLGRDDLTARSFFRYRGQRAYWTGDRGHLQEGHLLYDGREDGQVKLKGNRVELGDVEANLEALEGIEQAVVLVDDDALLGFVRPAGGRPPGTDLELSNEYRRRLQERLPAYMVPRRLVFLDVLPLTQNGKIDRRRLRELLP